MQILVPLVIVATIDFTWGANYNKAWSL